MKNTKRREFIKTTILGTGLASLGFKPDLSIDNRKDSLLANQKRKQTFNMCGYAAPKMEVVRIGFIGIGNRGKGSLERIAQLEGIEVVALCDKINEKVKLGQEILKKAGLPKAKEYGGTDNIWKTMCEKEELDLVYIVTPWDLHTPMAVYAMENGKHTVTEVPAATTLDECWQLVETSEKTRNHCMMLENCCYDRFELFTLNLAQKGFFGNIIHGEGAYLHDLLEANFRRSREPHWRLKENYRNGNLYPTHGLGPVCQAMKINRGDQMEYMVSMSSNDFHMAAEAKDLANNDSYYQQFVGKKFRGNMNTSIVRTYKGKTIMIQHDVTSPRPYSRIHILSGTKAFAQKYPQPSRISIGHNWLKEEEMKELKEKYTPEMVKEFGDATKKVGGHGGMDMLMIWRLIDCLRNGKPLDQDVYDAALWSSIAPLSEWSVANKSNSIDVPDFTRGLWQTNKPVNISLKGCGTTKIRKM